MKAALRQCRILRHTLQYSGITRSLFSLGLGVLLVLATLSVFYTRAGVHTRVYAATSNNLNFQARVSSSTGTVVNDGNYHIEFKLYNAPTGGTALWTETRTTGNLVRVANGYLTVNLGSVSAFPSTIDWSQEHWLTMNIGGTGGTPVWDGEMSPRLKLTAVPYAFRSGQADTLTNGSGTITASDLIQKTPVSLQEFNSLVAGIRLNQNGTGGLLQLQGDGLDVFTVSKTGSVFAKGSLDVDGAQIDIGTLTQSGALVMQAGNGFKGTLQTTALTANRVYVLPDEGGTICMQNSSSCGFLSSGTVFNQGGNSFGGLATLGTNDNFSLNFETNGTTKLTILPDGNVGIGVTNPFSPLHVSKNFNTAVAATQIGQYFTNVYSVADTGQKYGTYTLLQNTHTSGTITQSIGNATITIGAGSGGTTSTIFNNYSRVDSNAGHTVGNAFNHYIANNIGTGAMTNQYGLYVAALSGATNNWAIYTAGSTKSYFGGNVGIGTSGSPGSLLSIGGTTGNLVVDAAGNLTTAGAVTISSIGSAGMVKADSTGKLLAAIAGTDYELPLTFSNGLTRTTNAVALGGALTTNTDLAIGANNFSFSGSGGLVLGGTTASGKFTISDGTNTDTILANKTSVTGNLLMLQRDGNGVFTIFNSGALELRATSAEALVIRNSAGAATLTVDTSNGVIIIGNSGYLRFTGRAGDPSAPVSGDMWYSTTQNAHRLRTPIGNLGNSGLLCANTTVPAAVANTADLTDFGAEAQCTLPANSLAVGKVVRIKARGVYSVTGLTAPTLSLFVRSGSTTLGSSGAVSTNINARNWGFTLEFDVTVIGTGASGTVEGQGQAAVKTNGAQMLVTDMPNAGTIGLDTTVSQTLTLSAQWNVAATGNTATIRQVTYEVLN